MPALHLGSDLGIASLALSCGRKIKASLPQPTLELSPFIVGLVFSALHCLKDIAPASAKVEEFSTVGQGRCPGQRAFQDLNSAPEYQQVMTANGREKAQCQLQLLFA